MSTDAHGAMPEDEWIHNLQKEINETVGKTERLSAFLDSGKLKNRKQISLLIEQEATMQHLCYILKQRFWEATQ